MGLEAVPLDPTGSTDRLIIRPTVKIWLLTACSIGAATLGLAALGVSLLLRGRLVGLVMLPVSLGLGWMIYGNLGGYLWADAEQVGSTIPFRRWVARRTEIAKVRIGRYAGRSGTPSGLARAHGAIAYRVDFSVFGESGMTKLAAYLGVPLFDERKKH